MKRQRRLFKRLKNGRSNGMMHKSLKEYFAKAKEEKWALAQFNVSEKNLTRVQGKGLVNLLILLPSRF